MHKNNEEMKRVEDKDVKKGDSLEKKKKAIILFGGINIFISFVYFMLKKYSIEDILTFLSYAYFISCFIAIIIIITYISEKIKQKK